MLEEACSSLDMSESALNQYLSLVGTVAEARRNKIKTERALKQYTAFGTISDIAAMADKLNAMHEKLEQEKMEKACRKYSALTGQSMDTVKTIFETAKSKEDAIKLLDSMKSNIKTESASVSASAVKKPRFKKESIINDKNNTVLEKRKHESVEQNQDIAISKSVLRKFIRV